MIIVIGILVDDGIVIAAWNGDVEHIVGLMPKGMIPHLEPLMNDLENHCIQLERIDCDQLTKSMWITIDSLHHITL